MRVFLPVLLFLLTLNGCNSKSDKEYMTIADANAKKNNISEAVKAYETLLDKYPESSSAPEALYRLASLYQGNLINGISKEQSLRKSVQMYERIYDEYPKDKRAPLSLFMKGYILANELKNYDSARKTYILFIKKYPEHELAVSAKKELENMGLSPDQILNEESPKNI